MRYWADSKFANVLRGTEKPLACTAEDWEIWEQEAQEKHPVRYWLTETVLDKLENICFYPIDKLFKLKYYLVNRFITKTHVLKSGLKPGSWHELDNRLLFSCFNELVEFIEVEKAWMWYTFNPRGVEPVKVPWYAKGWFRLHTFRSAECGTKYLEWEIEEAGGRQAENAKKLLDLYKWWVYDRKMRVDPYDSDDTFSEEDRQYNEDTEKLVELMRIRGSLWT